MLLRIYMFLLDVSICNCLHLKDDVSELSLLSTCGFLLTQTVCANAVTLRTDDLVYGGKVAKRCKSLISFSTDLFVSHSKSLTYHAKCLKKTTDCFRVLKSTDRKEEVLHTVVLTHS